MLDMNVRIFGVDCAVDDANMGVACGRLTATGLLVQEATQCTRERRAIDTVVNWIEQEKNTSALLAIDAPSVGLNPCLLRWANITRVRRFP
jgi:predicted RNase H-like nuclease